MKILAFGDLHGDTKLAKNLAKKADEEDVDYVVICGDIVNQEGSLSNLIGLFKKKVLIVPGNHENAAMIDFLSQRYKAFNLHSYSLISRDNKVGFFGNSAANIGLFSFPENNILESLRKGFEDIKSADKKIMVTHTHPSESLISKFTTLVPGSTAVRRAIDELGPDLVLCSHVHEADGIEESIGNTKIINVGRKGKIIEI